MLRTTAELRDRLELLLSIPAGNSYVDSADQLLDINEAYEATAYAYDWPQLLVKRGARAIADNHKYPNPSNFRKFHYLYVLGAKYEETEPDLVWKSRRAFAVDLATDEFIINPRPGSTGTQFTFTNAESAGTSVTIETTSTTGLSAGDEIYIDDTTNPEVTYIQSVTANTNIVARLDTSKSASAPFYRGKDNIIYAYYRTITRLSATGDTTLLPDATDLILLHYAASLAYTRLEQRENSAYHYQLWEKRLAQIWQAFDKGSTGIVGQFTL